MITVTHQTPARPEQIWAVLADGWTYAAWVVGASRIRAVEGSLAGAGQPHPPLGRHLARCWSATRPWSRPASPSG